MNSIGRRPTRAAPERRLWQRWAASYQWVSRSVRPLFHPFTQGVAMENYPESVSSGSAQPINQTAEEKANAAELARQAARQVIDSGKEYAQNAVNAAGKKLTSAKEQMGKAAEQGTQYMT